MKSKTNSFFILFAATLLSFNLSRAQVTVTPDKLSGVYETGETAIWTLNLPKSNSIDSIGYTLKKRGWPQWYDAIEKKDVQKVREASRYFDVANFVPRIKCPVLVGIGLLDQTCPPEGIYAGLNQLSAQKEIILLPNSEHQAKNDSQQPYNDRAEKDWPPELLKGELPTLN